MKRIEAGIRHFRDSAYPAHKELFEKLRDGQSPEALFITCADSRIVPSLITNAEPGQLFIVRNVGNLVPPYETENNAERAAVEYAVQVLGVRDIVVCGHTGCGAMQALMDPPDRDDLAGVLAWLRHADETREVVKAKHGGLSGKELVIAAAQENVLIQLEHLRSLPCVANLDADNSIHLHGWMYDIGSGEISHYDDEAREYVVFGDTDERS